MIQDIFPKVFDNTYRDLKPEAGDWVLCYEGKTVGVTGEFRDGGKLWFPDYEEFCRNTECGAEDFVYLFAIDEEQYFLYLGGIPEWLRKEPVSPNLHPANRERSLACSTGCHLASWYRKHRFCGCCGKPLTHNHAMRMLQCEECGNVEFPVLEPAVIVGVTRGDQILITHYSDRIYKGCALVAGFVEIGESAESTVRREVMEEVGLHVKNIRFCGTQPWGIDNNLLLGYFAEVDGDAHTHIDTAELADAEWVNREDVPFFENEMALTMAMMNAFAKGEEPK